LLAWLGVVAGVWNGRRLAEVSERLVAHLPRPFRSTARTYRIAQILVSVVMVILGMAELIA